MISSEQLEAIVERISQDKHSKADIDSLQQLLATGEQIDLLQLGKYNINIGQGQDIQIGDRNYVEWNEEAIQSLIEIVQTQLPKAIGIPENIPRSGVIEFIGRSKELNALNSLFENDEQAKIAAISGMGGVGKTELALQYALSYKSEYPGGICWLQARSVDIGIQIVQFSRSRLQITPPDDLELIDQVGFCWRNWPEGHVLIVIDDVSDYSKVKPYLPPAETRFRVLLTTRLKLGRSVKQLSLDVLNEDSAIAFFKSLIGSERLQNELGVAKEIIDWLGYLPLGLELVGRYLDRKLDLSLAKMQQRLKAKSLETLALRKPDEDMTAPISINAAFELSWEELSEQSKYVAYLLSLFALAPIPWSLVEQCWLDEDEDELEEIRDDNLLKLNLIQRKSEGSYQLHQLSREFLQLKQTELVRSEELKRSFCSTVSEAAKKIPESLSLDLIEELGALVPHLAELMTALIDFLDKDKIVDSFVGLGRFYEGQGLYEQAENWYKACLLETEKRFDSNHVAVASSLSNLGNIYRSQGQYEDSEPLLTKALKLRQELFVPEHADIANSLNDLALLYEAQGRYQEAEALSQQSVEIRKSIFGDRHPDIADSLNNISVLYSNQGKYLEAEPLLVQALEMRKSLLGNNHPRIATSLNNLAYCYSLQEKYKQAEFSYLEAIALYQRLLGEEHPETVASLNNLASVYCAQKKYKEAEDLFISVLESYRRLFGNKHPNVANTLNNLAFIYDIQEQYKEAENLYLQALDMRKKILGEEHPHVAISLNNLGKLYFMKKSYQQAESMYIKALKILESSLGFEHPITVKVHDNLSELRDKSSFKE